MNYNQLFDIPIIHTVLASQFFDGPKSIAVRNGLAAFKSSIPGKPAELEIPKGMLILVLIVVCTPFCWTLYELMPLLCLSQIFHCLEDWTFGVQAET